MTQALMKLEKITDHTHDKYINTEKFNKSRSENFAARLEQTNLVAKTDLMMNYQILIEKLFQIKQKILVMKTN